MPSELEIPPPITEENRDQYLEELSQISEAENWVEKHSVENNSNKEDIVDNLEWYHLQGDPGLIIL